MDRAFDSLMLFLHEKLLDYLEKVEKESGVFNDPFEKRAA